MRVAEIAKLGLLIAYALAWPIGASIAAPTPPDLKAQLAADQATIARLTATNTAIVKGLHACQAQRNAAQDQALNDAMNAQ